MLVVPILRRFLFGCHVGRGLNKSIDELDRQKRGEDQSLSLETDDLFNYKVIGDNVQRLTSVGVASLFRAAVCT